MKFLHCSDLHLGTNRFGDGKLTKDFTTSFQHMADDAVRRDVDALIISGDIFNKVNVDPNTLLDAKKVLTTLQDGGVEVVAVEGNHDISIYSQEMSWIHYLSRSGLLKLLQIRYPDGRARLMPWSDDDKKGAFLDVDGVRFYGLGYLGASSSKKLELLSDALEPADFTVAMLHAGVDVFNDMDMGGVRKEDVELLREKVSYVALGHVHGRYSVDDWIYNPGGLENWRPEECIKKKGYYLVDVSGEKARVEAIDSVRRPGHTISVDITDHSEESQVVRSVKDAVERESIDPSSEPIISIRLTGKASSNLIKCDMNHIREWVISQTGAVECLVNDRSSFNAIGSMRLDRVGRHDVEREVMGELMRSFDISRLTQEEKVDLALRYKDLCLSDQCDRSERPVLLRDLILEALTKRGDA